MDIYTRLTIICAVSAFLLCLQNVYVSSTETCLFSGDQTLRPDCYRELTLISTQC